MWENDFTSCSWPVPIRPGSKIFVLLKLLICSTKDRWCPEITCPRSMELGGKISLAFSEL